MGVYIVVQSIGEEPGNGRGLDLVEVVDIPELVVNVILLAIRPEPVLTLHYRRDRKLSSMCLLLIKHQ